MNSGSCINIVIAQLSYSHQVSYLPKSYLWTKNETNRFSNSCHEIKILLEISLPSLLSIHNYYSTALSAKNEYKYLTVFVLQKTGFISRKRRKWQKMHRFRKKITE